MEPITIITSTITIFELISAGYKLIKDIKGLPKAFSKIDENIPVVQKVLSLAEAQLKVSDPDEETKQETGVIIKRCRKAAQDICTIFDDIGQNMPKDNDGRKHWSFKDCYKAAVLKLGGKRSRVELLMKAILEDVTLLANVQILKIVAQSHVPELERASEEFADIPPSLLDSDFDDPLSMAFTMYGDRGAMVNASGSAEVVAAPGNDGLVVGRDATFGADALQGLFKRRAG